MRFGQLLARQFARSRMRPSHIILGQGARNDADEGGSNGRPSRPRPMLPQRPRRRLVYAHLYVQVLAAIVLGALLGHFWPDDRARR